MTGGAAVARSLEDLGVDVVFDLPGLHTLPVYDALRDRAGIRRVMVKHEGSASVMADVYGRLTGDPGVALVAAGPGATNSLTGVAQAMAASSPMLHLSGTVPTDSSPSGLHGLGDPDYLRRVFSPVTKLSQRVTGVGSVARAIKGGYWTAMEPRKGPVHIELPLDVLGSSAASDSAATRPRERRSAAGRIARAASLLRESENPVIIAGKSVPREQATEDLIDLAERMASPVVVHSYYPDAFPFDHRLFAGDANEWSVDPLAEMVLKGADLIITVGVQWGSAETLFLDRFPSRTNVHVDVDAGFPAKGGKAPLTLTGNLKTILMELGNLSQPRLGRPGGVVEHLLEVKRRASRRSSSLIASRASSRPIYPGFLASEVARVAGDGAILALDGSSTSSWFMDVHARKRTCRLLWPGAYGSIGFAFPAGISAQIVCPERRVIVGSGDGGFLLSYNEMATAVENDLPMTVIITDNRLYGDIWHIQRARYGGRYVGTDLPAVDYVALAGSFGARGIRVDDPSDLGSALEEAFSSGRFTLLDVVTDGKSRFLFDEIKLG